MSTLTLALLGLFLVIILGLVFTAILIAWQNRDVGRQTPWHASTAEQVQPLETEASGSLVQEVSHLVASGLKIEAIKLYRDRTGAGLKDSKEAVERIARDPRFEPLLNTALEGARSGQLTQAELRRQVEELLRHNQKISAIKLYKEQTGVGLKEAKETVEQIERTL